MLRDSSTVFCATPTTYWSLRNSKRGRVIAIGVEELAEFPVLMRDGVLVDLGEEAKGDQGTEDAQCTGYEERVLT